MARFPVPGPRPTTGAEKGPGPHDALRRSWQLTSGVRLPVGLYILILGVGGAAITGLTSGFGIFRVGSVGGLANALIDEGLRANRPPNTIGV